MLDFLRAELAAEPFRGIRALRLAAIAVASLAISLLVGVMSALTGFLLVFCVAPDFPYTWHNLVRRIGVIAAAMVVAVPVVGVLAQVPWFALPTLFLVFWAGGALLPADRFPVEWMAVKFTVVSLLFHAQFAPGELGTTAVAVFWSFTIPLTTATVVSRLAWPESTRDLLDASLATTFDEIEGGVRRARDALLGAPGEPAEDGDVLPSHLARHLALVERFRRESLEPNRDAFYLGIATLAERASHDSSRLAYRATRLGASGAYVADVREELRPILEDLLIATAAYAAFFRGRRFERPEDEPAWPTFREQITRLDARRDELLSRGWYDRFGVEGATRLDDLVTTVQSLAERFRDPPEHFREIVAPTRRTAPATPWLDPDNTRFSFRAAVAATIAYVVASASMHTQLETAIWTTLHAAQFTYGATLRKMLLRVGGAAVGGAVAIAMAIVVLPNTADVGVYLISIFLVMLAAYYTSLGSPRIAYLGTQGAISFLLGYLSASQSTDVTEPIWRVFAIVLGDLILYGTFRALGPELASTRLPPRIRALVSGLRSLAPESGALPEPDREATIVGAISTELERLTTLADQARFEGPHAEVDVQAVFEVAASSRRILGRLQSLHELRRRLQTLTVVPEDLRALVADFESQIAAVLVWNDERPGSEAVVEPLPDLTASLDRLRRAMDRARPEIARLPADARAVVYSMVGQFERLTDLLRRFGAALERSRGAHPDRTPSAGAA